MEGNKFGEPDLVSLGFEEDEEVAADVVRCDPASRFRWCLCPVSKYCEAVCSCGIKAMFIGWK